MGSQGSAMSLKRRIQRWYQRHRREWLRRHADVHIISFPKCGRTWLVLMIARVIERHYGITVSDPLKLRLFRKKLRSLPLILQHHDGGPEFLRVDELEQDKSRYSGAKVIFLVRDPRDVTISAYFQKTRRNNDFSGTINEYLHQPVGSIDTNVEFYNIWARNRSVPRDFLLLAYEDMHEDVVRELRRVVEFLGVSGVPDTVLREAADSCSFENMRRMEADNALGSKRLAPRDAADETTYKTREGRVGGYVRHLHPAQITYMDDLIAERLDPLYARYWPGRYPG